MVMSKKHFGLPAIADSSLSLPAVTTRGKLVSSMARRSMRSDVTAAFGREM